MKLFAILAALFMAAPALAATPPVVATLPAKNGNVQFPHKEHMKLGCKKCHETMPPQKIELNKEKAHKLCWSCHQEMGKGPNGKTCTDCHKKA